MTKYAIERFILALFTTFIIITITFFLLKILPFVKPVGQNSARLTYYLTQVSYGFVIDFSSLKEAIAAGYAEADLLDSFTDSAKLTHYFFQVPVMEQYGHWFINVVTKWEWGTSLKISPNVDAIVLITTKLPTTIKVNIWSVLISVPAGIGLGIWAALKKNKLTDHIISTLVMVFISIPSFIIITFLLLILCYNNQILPSQWPSSLAPLATRVKGYIIPVMALSFGSICGYCRFTRAELTEVMSSDYLLLARIKGLTKSQTVVRHALKNAMVPILPSILSEVIGLLSGSMILEQLYGIPGVGKLYIQAINNSDYNVLMVDMAFYTVIGLVASVFLDLSYGLLDPRIRVGAKK